MKKTLMVIMMAMLAVSVAFAGVSIPEKGAIETASKTLTANLELTNADFAGYSMGFSTSQPEEGNTGDLVVKNVTDTTDVDITYNNDGTATSKAPVYFYYKVRTLDMVTIGLKADQLKTAGPEVKTLNYTITGEGIKGNSVTVNAPKTPVIDDVELTNAYAFATAPMTFTVSDLNADKIGTYTATLTLSVTAG